MEKLYTVKELLDKLQLAGIKIKRPTIFVKIKKGIIKPQAFTMVGKRRYPKYSDEYIAKLIACATVETKLDWNKVKDITNSQIEEIQKV